MATEIRCMKICQIGLEMYIGSMKAKDLLAVTRVEHCLQEQGVESGYQRTVLPSRADEIATYIVESKIAVFPSSIVLSLRKDSGVEIKKEREIYLIKIPERGNLWIADGQHRVAGVKRLVEITERENHYDEEVLSKAMHLEFPVTFLDLRNMEVEEARNVERAIFFIMNETQKRVPAILRDNLMHIISLRNRITHPIFKAQKSRIDAISLVKKLDTDEDSPLRGLIRMTTQSSRALGRPVNLNTMARAIEKGLMEIDAFQSLPEEKQFEYVKEFWNVLVDMFPTMTTNVKNNLLLGKAAVTYAVMKLAGAIYNELKKENKDPPSREQIAKALQPLKDFDFSKNSPIAAFGGYEGVEIIYWNWLRPALEKEEILKYVERPEVIKKIGEKHREMLEKLYPS